MIEKHFDNQSDAFKFGYIYLKKGRKVFVVRKKRRWFVRVFASSQR